ncbi:Uma2 family endonuclease [Actinoplanes sp. NPDC049316]|uniref:Uma2 family endonuclease n=1 Tax=Actinoplanes sp. NPDC049316 TaxID=3154727 RepID=UPI003425D854
MTTALHRSVAVEVCNALARNCPDDLLVSLDVTISAGPRRHVPAVAVLKAEAATASPVPALDVVLVAELASSSFRVAQVYERAQLYAAAAVPTFWIVDPMRKHVTFTEFLLGDDGDYRCGIETDGTLRFDRPWEVTLDLRAWTERRDQVRARERE